MKNSPPDSPMRTIVGGSAVAMVTVLPEPEPALSLEPEPEPSCVWPFCDPFTNATIANQTATEVVPQSPTSVSAHTQSHMDCLLHMGVFLIEFLVGTAAIAVTLLLYLLAPPGHRLRGQRNMRGRDALILLPISTCTACFIFFPATLTPSQLQTANWFVAYVAMPVFGSVFGVGWVWLHVCLGWDLVFSNDIRNSLAKPTIIVVVFLFIFLIAMMTSIRSTSEEDAQKHQIAEDALPGFECDSTGCNYLTWYVCLSKRGAH